MPVLDAVMPGIDVFRTRTRPRATLPARPPPVRYASSRSTAPSGGVAP